MITEGLRVGVEVSVLGRNEGGRSIRLMSGYRPLCVFEGEGKRVTVGLCELETATPIEPGSSGRATLIFDDRVASEARRLSKDNPSFELVEGDVVVAKARVISVV